jgi:DNA polymerase
VLFIGEAPGASEDVLGQPFVGPAGHLLDYILAQAGVTRLHYALTNLVACIPLEGGSKAAQPSKECILACRPRLQEFYRLCQPKLVVYVGDWAAKHPLLEGGYKAIRIIHPAAILRMNVAQQGLAIQRTIISLGDATEGL